MKTAAGITEVRRRDRAVEDESWLQEFLQRAPVGVLASVHEGIPFIHSNLFVFDAESRQIYFHTARTGRTRFNIESGSAVCFHVHSMGRLLPAARALEFSVEFAGVTVFGRAALVEDPKQSRLALKKLLNKYFPHLVYGKDYEAISTADLARTSVFSISIEQWSGKRKQVDPQFPGALYYAGTETGTFVLNGPEDG